VVGVLLRASCTGRAVTIRTWQKSFLPQSSVSFRLNSFGRTLFTLSSLSVGIGCRAPAEGWKASVDDSSSPAPLGHLLVRSYRCVPRSLSLWL
jgi:hypothetical protein